MSSNNKIILLLVTVLLGISIVPNVKAMPRMNGGAKPYPNKEVEFFVDCEAELGPLSPIWTASTSLAGIGTEHNPIGLASRKVLDDFSSEIGLRERFVHTRAADLDYE